MSRFNTNSISSYSSFAFDLYEAIKQTNLKAMLLCDSFDDLVGLYEIEEIGLSYKYSSVVSVYLNNGHIDLYVKLSFFTVTNSILRDTQNFSFVVVEDDLVGQGIISLQFVSVKSFDVINFEIDMTGKQILLNDASINLLGQIERYNWHDMSFTLNLESEFSGTNYIELDFDWLKKAYTHNIMLEIPILGLLEHINFDDLVWLMTCNLLDSRIFIDSIQVRLDSKDIESIAHCLKTLTSVKRSDTLITLVLMKVSTDTLNETIKVIENNVEQLRQKNLKLKLFITDFGIHSCNLAGINTLKRLLS